MGLHTLPTPGVDETLSSWLFRCSFHKHTVNMTRLALNARPLQCWEGLELKYADPDTDFLSASKRIRLGGEHIHPRLLKEYFCLRNGVVAEWRYRHFFCPECLRDDVANGHLPMWRKHWCYVNSIICNVHGRDLVMLSDASYYSKAWNAFVQECNSSSRSIAAKGSKLARFRLTTLSKIEHLLAYKRPNQRNILFGLFNSLFDILLQAPFHGSRGGAARIYFQSKVSTRFADPESFDLSILKGPSTADPPSRFGSMLLAASLLGVLPPSRFSIFIKACEDTETGLLLPNDLHKAAAFPHVDKAGYRVLHQYLGAFPRKDFPLLDRHLYLQEVRYAREGVVGAHRFGATHN